MQNELVKAHQEANGDSDLVKKSVRYCGLMAKWHGIRALLASMANHDDQTSRQESMASREWAKAQATAIEKSSFDTLQRIAQRLDAEDRLKGEMADI